MITPGFLNHRWTVRNSELAYGANGFYSIASSAEYNHLSPNELTVENNYIHDIGDTGHGNFRDGDSPAVGIQGGSNHLIQNNLIERTGSSIVLFSSPGQVMRDNIIRNNILKDIYAQASYGGIGIALSGFSTAPLGERTGNKFYNNIIMGTQGSGLTSNAPDLVEVYNNLFYNITSPSELEIYGTLYQNRVSRAFTTYSNTASHYRGHNNMFVNVKDQYVFISWGNYDHIESSMEWDHNLYFNPEPKETFDFYYKPLHYRDMDYWINDTPYDNRAVTKDPLLDIDGWTVTLSELSPAIDAGFDMQRDTDVYGNPIYGQPDIGPVEHQPGHVMGESMGSDTTVYADGRFRIASDTLQADLAVSPAGGWPSFAPTEHRPQWMKIQVQQWQKPLEWTETVSSPESVIHTVGGRNPNIDCQVYIDEVPVSSQTTDSDGAIMFTGDLTGEHLFTVVCREEPVTVQVLQGGHPVAGVPVYLFNSSGAYAGRHGVTDGAGEVSFLLPIGESYTFRADVLGSQFFSEAVTVADGGPNAVPLDTGGGLLTLTLQRAPGDYMAGVKAYLFSGSGVYLGLSETTSEQGLVSFEVPSGMYKIRADYLGQQFWTDPVAVASDAATPLTISHAEVDVRVVGENNGSTVPRADVPVCLFTADGAYQGISENTGPAGEAGFLLPPGQYKFRADYLNGQHWSDVIDQQSLAITINEGDANVSVTLLNHALEDVSVYVFDAAGTYLGLTDTTDTSDGAEEGTVVFRLPQGDYNFRADFMGNRYYSGVTTVIADQSNPIAVSTGGADFTLTVLERPDDGTEPVPGLPGVTCYLFPPTAPTWDVRRPPANRVRPALTCRTANTRSGSTTWATSTGLLCLPSRAIRT